MRPLKITPTASTAQVRSALLSIFKPFFVSLTFPDIWTESTTWSNIDMNLAQHLRISETYIAHFAKNHHRIRPHEWFVLDARSNAKTLGPAPQRCGGNSLAQTLLLKVAAQLKTWCSLAVGYDIRMYIYIYYIWNKSQHPFQGNVLVIFSSRTSHLDPHLLQLIWDRTPTLKIHGWNKSNSDIVWYCNSDEVDSSLIGGLEMFGTCFIFPIYRE